MSTFNWQESLISLLLGFLVVIVSGVLLYKYANQQGFFQHTIVSNTQPTKIVEKEGNKQEKDVGIQTNEDRPKETDEYIVKEHDTLWKIAEETTGNGFKWKEIAYINKISNPRMIVKGQKIKILPIISQGNNKTNIMAASTKIPATYEIQKGDSLWEISVKFYGTGETWREIASVNHIQNPGTIHPGNILKLPPTVDTLETDTRENGSVTTTPSGMK